MVYYEVYGGKMVTIRMIIEFNFYMILVPAWSEDGKIEYWFFMTIKNEGYQTEKINVKKTKAMRVYKGAYKKVGETALIITIYGKALETNKTSVGLNQHQFEPVKKIYHRTMGS